VVLVGIKAANSSDAHVGLQLFQVADLASETQLVLIVMETTNGASTKVAFIVWVSSSAAQLKRAFPISSAVITMG
jgi:hypothetical protein